MIIIHNTYGEMTKLYGTNWSFDNEWIHVFSNTQRIYSIKKEFVIRIINIDYEHFCDCNENEEDDEKENYL